MSLQAVFFDLYGTLIDIDVDESQASLWQAIQALISPTDDMSDPRKLRHQFEKCLQKASRRTDSSIFETAVRDFLHRVPHANATSRDEFQAVFRRASRQRLALRPYAVKLIQRLKRAGLKVALISNTEAALTRIDLYDVGMESVFELIILSSDIGIEKPDPRIFLKALNELHLTPDEVVYIGDNQIDDIQGSAAAGIRSILITNQSAVRRLPELCIGTTGIDGREILKLLQKYVAMPHAV